MKCKNCGMEFVEKSVVQKYCSASCEKQYWKSHDINNDYPSITFNCAKCGRTVTTDGTSKDRRTRFCSPECEKKYWRHPPREGSEKHNNGNGIARMHFHSVSELASWERRTNGEQNL